MKVQHLAHHLSHCLVGIAVVAAVILVARIADATVPLLAVALICPAVMLTMMAAIARRGDGHHHA